MSTPRDHLHDIPARARLVANRARVGTSNAWHRAAGRRVQGARGRVSNWRNQRTLERGRRDMPRRASDSLRSSLPVVRNRTDPATGRPNRDRAALGRTSDASLARMAPRVRADRAAPQAGPDARRTDAARDVAGRARIERLFGGGQREHDHLTARDREQARIQGRQGRN